MDSRPLQRVRFLLGRAGSGKTYRCLEEMRRADREEPLGPPLILLVPEQATYQMDRALLDKSPRRASLRCQVLSFRRLSYLVLEGQLTRRRVLSELGREMVIQALLRRRRDDWHFFDASRVRPGWLAHLSRLIHELRQYRVTTDMLQRAGSALSVLSGGDSPLVRKLHDLALLLDDYQNFLAERCYDSDDVAGLLTLAIHRSPWLHGARLWVDSFGDFTKMEYEVLDALLHTVSEATFSLCLDADALLESDGLGDSTRLFHRAEETYRRLRELVPGETPVELIRLPEEAVPPRFRARQLQCIEKEMFADLVPKLFEEVPPWSGEDGVPAKGSPFSGAASGAESFRIEHQSHRCVTLLEARHRRAEVEYVARTIRKLVMQEGWRYRELAVIVRRLEDYQSLIEAVFPDYGIPFFMDVRRSVRHHPLVELVRATVRVAADNWRRVDVVRWLRTDLPTRSSPQPWVRELVDRLEQYADEHGLDGEVWRAQRWRVSAPAGDNVPEYLQPEVLNRERLRLTEPLAEFCRSLGEAREISVHTALAALWRMLERLGVAQSLSAWQEQARAAGRLEEAAEHAQVWDGLVQVFDELEMALGREKLSCQDFAAVLETALDSLTLGLVPPALDEVLIGAIERSRQPELRGVFLLGVNEGIFPLTGDEDALLNDTDREQLHQLGIELAPTAEARHYQEQYLGYVAFTRASERLWVSYALADEQHHSLLPSPFIERLQRLFPELQPERVEGGVGTISWHEALTWSELASAAAREVRSHVRWGKCYCTETELEPPKTSASARCPWEDWWEPTQQRPVALRMVERAARFDPTVQLPPALAKLLFLQGSELRLSVSELESYAQCPFQFFAGSGLRLRARQTFRLSRQDLGELLHRILQFFVPRYIRELVISLSTSSGTHDTATKEDEDCTRRERLRRVLHEVADSVLQELEDDRFEASARRQHVMRQAQRILGDYVVALDRQLRRGSFLPIQTEIFFGHDEQTAQRWAVELSDSACGQVPTYLVPRGRIDRLDIALDSDVETVRDKEGLRAEEIADQPTKVAPIVLVPDTAGGLAGHTLSPWEALGVQVSPDGRHRSIAWLRVVDYKLSPMSLDFDRMYHGLDLQLMLYLLVAQDMFGVPVGRSCAFYAPLRRQPKKMDTAQENVHSHSDWEWLRGYRLSGVFPVEAIEALDRETDVGYSPIVALYIKKDGTLGRENQSDAVDSADLEALAERTRQRLRRLGQAILQGEISVRPTLHRNQIPCSMCSWLAVCRFDRAWYDYNRLPALSKEEVLSRLRGASRA
ncbi:MAG: PD-(D/E)XK nuclease family protein [Gemmatales bacterium]|nr:PD-(D/E)XK nuclease family protein [Gemmatales bacterium]MDW8175188.1 PD-(D/E)XK nuclease family protein [Gemmatales bacterium]